MTSLQTQAIPGMHHGSAINCRYLRWFGLVCLAVLLRLGLACLGGNFDLRSFDMVGQLAYAGDSVYASTDRYNYGPIWFLILGALKWLQTALGYTFIDAFHILIVGVLSLVDVMIAILLRDRFGWKPSLFFLLNPVTVFITGYHSQFDNLALLPGLAAFLILSRSTPAVQRDLMWAALLLGLSLTTKHVLALMPFWLVVYPGLAPLRCRVLVAVVAVFIFLLGFLPYLFDHGSRTGVIHNVFLYDSKGNLALLPQGMLLVGRALHVPHVPELVDRFGSKIFMACMVLVGLLIRRRANPVELFLIYLVALVAFSSATANQYLAIPMIALAFCRQRIFVWIYIAVCLLAFAFQREGLGDFAFMARAKNLAPISPAILRCGAQLLLLFILGTWFRPIRARGIQI